MKFVLGIGGVEILGGKHGIEVQIIITVALAQRLFRLPIGRPVETGEAEGKSRGGVVENLRLGERPPGPDLGWVCVDRSHRLPSGVVVRSRIVTSSGSC